MYQYIQSDDTVVYHGPEVSKLMLRSQVTNEILYMRVYWLKILVFRITCIFLGNRVSKLIPKIFTTYCKIIEVSAFLLGKFSH